MKNFINKIFLKDLQEIQERTDAGSNIRTKNTAWPSESSATLGPITVGECKRALFYKIVGVEPTDVQTVYGQGVCDAGLMYERYHIDKFKRHGLHHESQTRIEFPTPTRNSIVITGKIDCLIKDENKTRAIEIKSVSAFKAAEIFGGDVKKPMPSPSNLMQAELYKLFADSPQGKEHGIEEVYLMYVNRSDGSVCYFKVDLDKDGWPIITSLNQAGTEIYTMALKEQPSYEELLAGREEATTEQGRVAGLRINVNAIISSFDSVYDHVKEKSLPAADYKLIYDASDLEREFMCGRISKRKLNAAKKGEQIGDQRCGLCAFKKRCLSDSGFKLKAP